MLYNENAQFTVIAMIYMVVTLFIFLAMYPAISEMIDTYTAEMDSTTAMVVRIIPPILAVMIIISGFMYMTPLRQGA